MKNKLYKAMAAALLVGACLVPSTMAQAEETDGNTLLYSFPINIKEFWKDCLPDRKKLSEPFEFRLCTHEV